MNPKPPTSTEPVIVACDICLTEIPESVAFHPEGDEYVQHFCGIECYSKWKKQRATAQNKDK